jgi:hypothetical protein
VARARVGRAALGACWVALGAALALALFSGAEAQGQGVSFEPVEPQAKPIVAPKPKPKKSPKPAPSPSAKASRPTTASSPRAPLTTEERVAAERARAVAAFAITLPPGWRAVDPGSALMSYADVRRPGVTAAVYLESRARSEPVTEALVKIFRERTRGVVVTGRACRGVSGRPAVFSDAKSGAGRERAVVVPREPGRRSRQYYRLVVSMAAGAATTGGADVNRLFDSFRIVEGRVVKPSPEEEKLAAQIVRGTVDAAAEKLHREVVRALGSGDEVQAAAFVRQWPLATETVLAGLEPDGPEAQAVARVRRAELLDIARRVVKGASKQFPHQVVGVEVLAEGGLHRYRGTEPKVGAWMASRAKELIAERGARLEARVAPGADDARFVREGTLYEVAPKTGVLDERGIALEEVIARNRWAMPPVAPADALREAGLAYRRYHQAVRQAPAAEQALRGARHVVRADAARTSARTTDEAAALAFHRALAETRDVARALEISAASVAPVLGPDGASDPLAATITFQPLGERLVEQALREALGARLDEIAKPRATPEVTLQVMLENMAVRAGTYGDRQLARRLLAAQAAMSDPALRRALLEHALVPGTEATEAALLDDLAWVPRGAREQLVGERADARRIAARLPAVGVLAREDAALLGAARWLDRRVRVVAPGASVRLGEGRWRRVAGALGPALTALVLWGRVDEVARAVEGGGDPAADAAVAKALAGALVRAALAVRKELAWLDDAGGSAFLPRRGEEGEGAYGSLRAARDVAAALIERAGGGDAGLAERVLAEPWLDHAHEGSVFAKLAWTPWTLAADVDARPMVSAEPTVSVSATSPTTPSTAPAADARLVAAVEEALPEAGASERARVVAVLDPLVETSRGGLARLAGAAAKDRKRRERMVAGLLESGSSGLAAAVALSWSVDAVNRGLRGAAR